MKKVNKKIPAYTLMEITIAMLLSAICISICYTAYGLIHDYYIRFHDKNEINDQVLSLGQVMRKDFLQADAVIQTDDGITIQRDSTRISYHFRAGDVLREHQDVRTDTFNIPPVRWQCYFENVEVTTADTIDRITFTLQIKDHEEIPFQYRKLYSAQQLITDHETH